MQRIRNLTHGLAGFQAGCRCAECAEAESTRMHGIAKAEKTRWREANGEADRQWAAQSGIALVPPDAMRLPWTTEEITVARDPSLSVKEAAAMLDRTPAAVSAKRYKRP